MTDRIDTDATSGAPRALYDGRATRPFGVPEGLPESEALTDELDALVIGFPK